MNNKQQDMRQWCMTDSISDNQSEESCSNQDCRITLRLVENETQKFHFRQIVHNYHSYKQKAVYVGRQLNFLIYKKGTCIGCIGFGSHVLPEPKAFKLFIGWGKEAFNQNFNKVANNWRFTLIEQRKGDGSKILSLCNTVVPFYWKKIYGEKLVLLTTFVGRGYEGTVYKASGWQHIGKTAGFGGKRNYRYADCKQKKKQINKHKGGMLNFVSDNNIKDIYVKPLHRYWKKELLHLKEI